MRKKKQGRKTLFHVGDFASISNVEVPEEKYEETSTPPKLQEQEDRNLQGRLQNLQNQKSLFMEQSENLQKVNNNLTEQLNKYAILLSEEKSEKKTLLEKYDTLQNTYNKKIEQFARKYYLLLGVCIALLLLLISQYASLFWEVLGV